MLAVPRGDILFAPRQGEFPMRQSAHESKIRELRWAAWSVELSSPKCPLSSKQTESPERNNAQPCIIIRETLPQNSGTRSRLAFSDALGLRGAGHAGVRDSSACQTADDKSSLRERPAAIHRIPSCIMDQGSISKRQRTRSNSEFLKVGCEVLSL